MAKTEAPLTSLEKGYELIGLISRMRKFKSHITRLKPLLSQFNKGQEEVINWTSFVTFPRELDKAFRGSTIEPDRFVDELKKDTTMSDDKEKITKLLLSNELGSDRPVFTAKNDGFELNVNNGSFNEHAISMSVAASHGFKFENPLDRAEYQNAMHELAKPIIAKRDRNFGVRVFDDCIASGDSIYGYLYELSKSKEGQEKLRAGVRIDAIVATPQAILLFKQLAKKIGFHLEINVSHLGYGLSDQNYIVYPEEILREAPDTIVSLKNKDESDKDKKDVNIYVVGDMGNAQKGISDDEMKRIREVKKDSEFCKFNDTRTDPHGNHPNKANKAVVENPDQPAFDFVYFARGGYLPLEFDRELNPYFKDANKIVMRGARRLFHLTKLVNVYGVVFGDE